jgi:hypothetical protein
MSCSYSRGRGTWGHSVLAASPALPESAASVVTGLDQAGLISEDYGLGPVAEAEFGE